MRVPMEAMRVCKSHEVALEEVEWANTGHEESACRGYESNCKDHGSACRGLGILYRGYEIVVEAIKMTNFWGCNFFLRI